MSACLLVCLFVSVASAEKVDSHEDAGLPKFEFAERSLIGLSRTDLNLFRSATGARQRALQ